MSEYDHAEWAAEHLKSKCDHCQPLREKLSESERKLKEADEIFDLQRKRMVLASSLWQAFHNKPDTIPDLGELLEWLVERFNTLVPEFHKVTSERDEAKRQLERSENTRTVLFNRGESMQRERDEARRLIAESEKERSAPNGRCPGCIRLLGERDALTGQLGHSEAGAAHQKHLMEFALKKVCGLDECAHGYERLQAALSSTSGKSLLQELEAAKSEIASHHEESGQPCGFKKLIDLKARVELLERVAEAAKKYHASTNGRLELDELVLSVIKLLEAERNGA